MTTKKSFIESRLYPIVFIIILTTVFTGMLAFFYHSTKDKVTQYNELKFQETILHSLNINNLNNNINELFKKHIKILTYKDANDSLLYYQGIIDKKIIGYAFVIKGSGLWGSIEAVIAFDAKLKTILNLQITNQNETPGLGARITEDWFLKQFNNLVMFKDMQIQRISLIDENEQPKSPYEINRITGATSSTKAVVDMILKESQNIKEKVKVK
ncbi:MAG: FMN-binding protein [Candidatus Cloacimonetes bacterium]|nr:FMN-binding protein [Candidatus Cloacimonadota bacterium]